MAPRRPSSPKQTSPGARRGPRTESRGAALDANILSTIATLGAEQASNLERKSESYMRNLKAKFGMGSGSTGINWCVLAELGRRGIVCMYACMCINHARSLKATFGMGAGSTRVNWCSSGSLAVALLKRITWLF